MINTQAIIARIDTKYKKLHNHRSLPITLVRNFEECLAIKYTYHSNALEGNSLSLSETALVIEHGITIGGKTVREHLEAINHAQAIEFIKEISHKKTTEIALDDILAIHKIILQKNDDLNAGTFRKVAVRITGSPTSFPNYAKVPLLMVDFMQWLHTTYDHPTLIAALAHFKLVTIHPFIDGNGRTARLLMNLILLQHGYPLAIIKKENRAAYIAAIENARETENFEPFYHIVLAAIEESLDNYLQAIAESDLS
jgi:Fic family protein